MVLSLYAILTWLLSVFLYFAPKKILFVESAFVFMVLTLCLRNIYSILGLNLEYLLLPKEEDLYIAFILYRSIIFPIVLLVGLNYLLIAQNLFAKCLVLSGCAGSLLLLELLSVKLGLMEYTTWNLFYQMMVIISLCAIATASLFFLRHLLKREVSG